MNLAGLQLVQQLLAEKSGQKINRLEASPVSGGDINRAYRLSDGQQQFFIKINNADRLAMFQAEKYGLDEIQRSNSIRVPRAIACGIMDEHAYIVMEYLELSGKPYHNHNGLFINTMSVWRFPSQFPLTD